MKCAVDEIRRAIARLGRACVVVIQARPRTAPARPIARISRRTRAARHGDALAPQLPPDLARPVDLMVRVPDALNRDAQLVIALRPRATGASDRRCCALVSEVGRRGDRQHGADRLDPIRSRGGRR